SFLEDVTRVIATVVETSPWRRRVGEAILKWEGEGIRTARLEDALQADTAPDVDALLDQFSRDATRLLQIRDEVGDRAAGERLDDPDQLARAESVLASIRSEERKGEV